MNEGQIDAEAPEPGRALFERALQRRIKGLDYLPPLAPLRGASPRDRLIDSGTMTLFRYRPRSERTHGVPVLLVMATGHRGQAADLQRGQSLVEHLLIAGFDLFMLEWAPPGADERYLKYENYILDFLPRAAARVRRESGSDALSVIGYRSGGSFALIWAALNPDRGPRNLVCVATPYDYSQLQLQQAWCDRESFDVDTLVDRHGCCPTDLMDGVFALAAEGLPVEAEIGLWDRLWAAPDASAVRRYIRWMGDMLPQAGEYFRQTVKQLMWENRLMLGSFEVGGRPVAAQAIGAAYLQVVADADRLVPPASSRPLIDAIGSPDKSELIVTGGHASLFLGDAARRSWPVLAGWLAERSA